ncbi:hypothetical protein GGR56DRAFT_490593 [Xylariaceae sp. FL0804]|nr:hypothetical protein GGR56DRAFT_490593 [Xylariaceae sp. FL0804]
MLVLLLVLVRGVVSPADCEYCTDPGDWAPCLGECYLGECGCRGGRATGILRGIRMRGRRGRYIGKYTAGGDEDD